LLPSKKAVNKYVRDVGETAVDTVYLNLADYLAARGPNLNLDDWRYRCEVAQTIIEGCFAREDKSSQPRLLDGNDIMDAFDIEPGPELGRLLLLVEDAWLEGEIETKYEALALVKAALESGDSNA
jgi:hypothetical protein